MCTCAICKKNEVTDTQHTNICDVCLDPWYVKRPAKKYGRGQKKGQK